MEEGRNLLKGYQLILYVTMLAFSATILGLMGNPMDNLFLIANTYKHPNPDMPLVPDAPNVTFYQSISFCAWGVTGDRPRGMHSTCRWVIALASVGLFFQFISLIFHIISQLAGIPFDWAIEAFVNFFMLWWWLAGALSVMISKPTAYFQRRYGFGLEVSTISAFTWLNFGFHFIELYLSILTKYVGKRKIIRDEEEEEDGSQSVKSEKHKCFESEKVPIEWFENQKMFGDRRATALVWIGWYLFLCSTCPIAKAVDNHSLTSESIVSFRLSSGWSQVPIELQFCEWVAQRDPTQFWNFVQDMFVQTVFDSDQASWEWSETWIANQWDVSTARVASWSVLAVEQLPNILFQNELAMNCWSQYKPNQRRPLVFAEWNNRVYESLSELEDELNQLTSNDSIEYTSGAHWYPMEPLETSHRPVILLYGQLASRSMKPWHDTLYALAKKQKIVYGIRHSVTVDHSPMYLQGYGAEIFIKNTEYRVQDQSAYPRDIFRPIESYPNTKDISTFSDIICIEQGNCFVSGVEYSTLVDSHHLLKDQALDLKKELKEWELSKTIKELRHWEVRNIGLSAAYLITHHIDPFMMLERISGNLPVYAPLLAGALSVSSKQASIYREVITEIEELGIEEQILFNGRLLSLPWGLFPPSITRCMDAITVAKDFVTRHHKDIHSQNEVLQYLFGPAEPAIRLFLDDNDISFIQNGESINWLLERNRMSENTPSVIHEYFHFLQETNKNPSNRFIDLVFVFDPLDPKQLVLLSWMKQILDHKWPIRMGIVLIPCCSMASRNAASQLPNQIDWFNYTQHLDSISEETSPWYSIASSYCSCHSGQPLVNDTLAELLMVAFDYLTQVPCPMAAYYFLVKMKQEITIPVDLFSFMSGMSLPDIESLDWIHLKRSFLFAWNYAYQCEGAKYQQKANDGENIWNELVANHTESKLEQVKKWSNAVGLVEHLPSILLNGIPLTDVATQLMPMMEQEMKMHMKYDAFLPFITVPRYNPKMTEWRTPLTHPNAMEKLMEHWKPSQLKYFKTKSALHLDDSTADESKKDSCSTAWIIADFSSLSDLQLLGLALEWLSSPMSVPSRLALIPLSYPSLTQKDVIDSWEEQVPLLKKQVTAWIGKEMMENDTLSFSHRNQSSLHIQSFLSCVSLSYLQKRIEKPAVIMNGILYSASLFQFPTDFDLAATLTMNTHFSKASCFS
eukprot:jgi/Galph1/4104/GphlegSOOS_G2773.1